MKKEVEMVLSIKKQQALTNLHANRVLAYCSIHGIRSYPQYMVGRQCKRSYLLLAFPWGEPDVCKEILKLNK